MTAFACPCCGFLTLPERPPGTFFVCPVCYWEDDDLQFGNPELTGGANRVSLVVAKSNFARFGASTPDAVSMVRGPKPDEIPH